jgi:hypothetical protein
MAAIPENLAAVFGNSPTMTAEAGDWATAGS